MKVQRHEGRGGDLKTEGGDEKKETTKTENLIINMKFRVEFTVDIGEDNCKGG